MKPLDTTYVQEKFSRLIVENKIPQCHIRRTHTSIHGYPKIQRIGEAQTPVLANRYHGTMQTSSTEFSSGSEATTSSQSR